MKQNSTNPDRGTPTAEVIQGWLILKLSTALHTNADKIDVRLPLTSFGLDSILTFNLTGDLADWLGYDLPATLLWDYPTIEKLAGHLAYELAEMARTGVLHREITGAAAEFAVVSDQAKDALESKGDKNG